MTNERRNAEFLRSRQSIIVVIKSNCVHLNLKIKPSKIIQDRRIEKQTVSNLRFQISNLKF